jgi:hypothetical protein
VSSDDTVVAVRDAIQTTSRASSGDFSVSNSDPEHARATNFDRRLQIGTRERSDRGDRGEAYAH